MPTQKKHNDFIKEIKIRNPKVIVLGMYESSRSRIAVKCCKCSHEWSPSAGSILKGHGCPKCGGTMRKTPEEFYTELKSKRDDITIIGTYNKALEKTRFGCLKCGNEWDATPAHILHDRGCPKCAQSHRGSSQRLTIGAFEKRLRKIDPNLVVQLGGKYINYNTPIPLQCLVCEYEYEIKPSNVLHSRGCPNCHKTGTSFFEQFIYHAFAHILGESKVISRDKTAIGVELDIFIPELKAAVEPGSWYWHKNLVRADHKKQKLCKAKGIRLITLYDRYDAPTVPFGQCYVIPCNLSLDRNLDKLIEISINILLELVPHLKKVEIDWKEIKRKAQKDSKRMSTKEFKEEIAKINDKIEIMGDYTLANNKIKVKCKICHHEWGVAPTSLRAGSGCRKCAGTLPITNDHFVSRLSILQPDMIPQTDYLNMSTKVTVKCKVCNHLWSAYPLHLISKSGAGCRECYKRVRGNHEDFVIKMAKVSPRITVLEKFKSINKPILVKCNECGGVWQAHPVGLLWGSCVCKNCKTNT